MDLVSRASVRCLPAGTRLFYIWLNLMAQHRNITWASRRTLRKITPTDSNADPYTVIPAEAGIHFLRSIAQRNPTLLLVLVGLLLLRFDTRRLFGLLFHDPPRKTRT